MPGHILENFQGGQRSIQVSDQEQWRYPSPEFPAKIN